MSASVQLAQVAQVLGDLRQDVVFVGGMVRSLLVTDAAVPGFRPTLDVDVIVEVHSPAQWAEWEPRIRAAGLKPDPRDEAPLCRYVRRGKGGFDLTIDFMPLDERVFGFSNRWYPSAFAAAELRQVEETTIRVIDAVHFVATKLEAFRGRGNGDFYHHDLEDVVVIIDGRPELHDELERAPAALRRFVTERIRELDSDRAFHLALPGHLPPDRGSQARLPLLERRLAKLAALADPNPV